jgi:hypothetical protein
MEETMSKELDRMVELSGLNDSALSPKDKQKIVDLALKVSEKNLASGNWTQKTAQFYNKTAHDQPEDLTYLLKGKQPPKNFKK